VNLDDDTSMRDGTRRPSYTIKIPSIVVSMIVCDRKGPIQGEQWHSNVTYLIWTR